jgi:hypothetical protein
MFEESLIQKAHFCFGGSRQEPYLLKGNKSLVNVAGDVCRPITERGKFTSFVSRDWWIRTDKKWSHRITHTHTNTHTHTHKHALSLDIYVICGSALNPCAYVSLSGTEGVFRRR